jgi:hypothetical protein
MVGRWFMKVMTALVLGGLLMVPTAARAEGLQWTLPQTVSVAVGQSASIYAKRANDCGAPPPSFAEIQGRLPKTALGTFSDAGVVQRMSAACTPDKRAVWVEARGITFTAAKPGSEILRFFGDSVSLTVR